MTGWKMLLAAVLLAAGWSAAAAGQTHDVTDSAGRTVAVPSAVARVLPAGPPAAVLLYTLAPDKLIGWTAALPPAALALLPQKYASLPVVGRVTSPRHGLSAEAIAALRPDVILDVGTVDAHYAELAARVEKETGVPYLLFDGSLAAAAATYRALGAALRETARGEALARAAEALLAEAKAASAAAGRRPRVYYARGKGGTATAAAGAMTAEFLAAAGAENVVPPDESGSRAPVTVAEVSQWQPDAVVAYDPEVYAAILSDPAWQQVAAVRERRLYLAPALPFSWIDEPPGVNRLIGLAWLAGLLAKGALPADMAARARDFYDRFYHVALTEAQLEALLKTAPE